MDDIRQYPSKGHEVGCRQLQVFNVLILAEGGNARTGAGALEDMQSADKGTDVVAESATTDTRLLCDSARDCFGLTAGAADLDSSLADERVGGLWKFLLITAPRGALPDGVVVGSIYVADGLTVGRTFPIGVVSSRAFG